MAKAPVQLHGKTAIVTGAAGGVGSALSAALAREGVAVAMADLDGAALEAAAARISGQVRPGVLDVTDRDAWQTYFDEVERELGPVDILCNVAGIMPISAFETERDAITDKIFAVNLLGPVYSSKEAARRMKPRGYGHIVNVASGGGWMAGGGGASYCSSKFGVVGYSEAAYLELRGTGVNVSVIAPGVINTALASGLKQLRGMRSVEPSEVADAIVNVLKFPRFAVFVPKTVGVAAFTFSAIPYRARHFLSRMARVDQLLLQADLQKRNEYEGRFADSDNDVRIAP